MNLGGMEEEQHEEGGGGSKGRGLGGEKEEGESARIAFDESRSIQWRLYHNVCGCGECRNMKKLDNVNKVR